jgi:hypothetical protein
MTRTEWLLGGILAMLLLAAAALAVNHYWQPTTAMAGLPAATPRPQLSAQRAYAAAEPVARHWAIDANLIFANTTWEPGGEWRHGESDWTFTFYSAAKSATALVAVTGESGRLISKRETDQAWPATDLQQWQVDSPAFMEQFLSTDGAALLEDETAAQTNLFLTLRAVEPMTWEALALDEASERGFSLHASARNGQILKMARYP